MKRQMGLNTNKPNQTKRNGMEWNEKKKRTKYKNGRETDREKKNHGHGITNDVKHRMNFCFVAVAVVVGVLDSWSLSNGYAHIL